MEAYGKLKTGERGAWLSIMAYLVLSALKLTIGSIAGSEALRADGLNNTTDIIASVAVLIGLRLARKPPDHNHKYGHFRAETIATLIASLIMIVVGVQVLFAAGEGLLKPTAEPPEWIAAWTAFICGLVMFAVYAYNMKLSLKVNSSALRAAALDNRSDAFVSLGAFVGILGSQFGLIWLDTLTAAIVGIIICKTGIHIFIEATHSLSDGFPEKELKQFKKTIQETPGCKKLKEIKARVHGNYVLLDVTILVNEHLSVAESHSITEEIERRMKEEHNVEHVHIHIEPA